MKVILAFAVFVVTPMFSLVCNAAQNSNSSKVKDVSKQANSNLDKSVKKIQKESATEANCTTIYRFPVENFSSISISGPFLVLLKKAKKDEKLEVQVEVEGKSTDISTINIDVKGEVCTIKMVDSDSFYFSFLQIGSKIIKKESPIIKVIVPYHNIIDIKASNLAFVKMFSKNENFIADNLTIILASASAIEMDLKIKNDLIMSISSVSSAEINNCEAKRMFCDLSAASCLRMNLSAELLEINISEASKILSSGKVNFARMKASSLSIGDFKNLIIKSCEANVNANSKLILNVSKNLTASVYALSKIVYVCEPQKMVIEKGGMSEVIKQ